MTATLPMLSGEGWQKDPDMIMSKLFIHIFLTDYSQSNIYQGKVTSLQYILAEYGDDVPKLTREVTEAVKTYYRNYFDSADVEFELSQQDDPDVSAKMIFDIRITTTLNGKTYDLNRTMQIDNSSGSKRFMEAFSN